MIKAYLGAAAIAALSLSASVARAADAIPYPDIGTPNVASYSFTAASTGDLIAYIVGGFGADFDNELGVLVNGVAQGGFGLDNHSSSVGDSFDFGPVNAGDTLTFVLKNNSLGAMAYSDPSLNVAYDSPGYSGTHQHIYSTTYTATTPLFAGVPKGTYVAFEDLPFPGSDFNYNDESFVFENTRLRSGTPEPATWGLMLLGVFGLGSMLRSHRRAAAA
jgi:hypothetical protein